MRRPWQQQFGSGARAELASQAEGAVRLLGKAIDHAEAEAAAFPRFLGREKRLHDLLEVIGCDPCPVVGHAELQIAAGWKLGPVPGCEFFVLHRDGQRPACGHRISRIDDEIDERELQLRLVGKGVPEILAVQPLDIDKAAERMSEEVANGVLQFRKIDNLRLELLPPRGSKPAPYEPAPLFRRTPRHGEDPQFLVLELGALLEKTEAADDRGQKIVEVVRYT